MENPIVTKEFVSKLSESLGAKFGAEVSYMDALERLPILSGARSIR
jgi:hypothetical protein